MILLADALVPRKERDKFLQTDNQVATLPRLSLIRYLSFKETDAWIPGAYAEFSGVKATSSSLI